MRRPVLPLRLRPRALRAPHTLLSVGFALLVAAGVAAPLLALLARSAARPAPYADPPFRDAALPDWLPRWTPEALSIARLQDAALGTLLQLAAALVLLLLAIALVDLLTLLLARAATRRHEAAMRAVLGATQLRLLRQWLGEAAAIVLPALLLGAALALAVGRGAAALWPHDAPPWLGAGPAAGVQAAVVGATLATALLAWLSPIGVAWRRDLRRYLTTGGRATAGRGEVFLRNALAVLQVAASLVLLMSAGLLLRGFVQPAGAPAQSLGFDPRDTLALRIELPAGADAAARAAAYGAVLQQVAALPGVADTGLATPGAWLGLGTTDRVTTVCPECRIGMMLKPVNQGPSQVHAVSPGHFRALGATLASGREFGDADRAGATRVAVINRTFAYRLFPNGEPLGKQVQLGGAEGEWYTVVGIVDDLRAQGIGVAAEPARAIYLPVLQHAPAAMELAVRGAGGAAPDAGRVEQAVRAAAPGAVPHGALPVAEHLARFRAPLRWFGLVLGGAAALSLLLAAAGLHGVMRYNVERRTREIGIRIALGATRGEVIRLVLHQSGRTTWIGTVLGLWGALSVARLLQLWFRGVDLFDPLLFAALSLMLAAVALGAAYRPARTAAAVDPRISLQAE